MQSKAKTPAEYIKEIPAERQAIVKKLHNIIKKNLPKGFSSEMSYGMLAYPVPHRVYPDGYHCDTSQPLPFMNLANQKQYVAVYHMGMYDGPLLEWFKKEWKKASSQKLDMGKCCIRLKKMDDIPYELFGKLAKKMTAKQWIKIYEETLKR